MRRCAVICCVLLIIAVFSGAGLYNYLNVHYWLSPSRALYTQVNGDSAREPATVLIEPGTPSSVIIAQLEQQQIITNPWLFTLFAYKEDDISRYQAGEYAFTSGLTPQEISNIMAEGLVVERMITIPEGWLSEQVVARINAQEVLEGVIDTFPKEGSILPDTYHFRRGESRQAVLKRMQEAMTAALNAAWEQRDTTLPLKTKQEALILASIVEKETSGQAEQEDVAGVFINRLNRQMKLQSDPTANYGLYLQSGKLKKRMLRVDVSHASDYNTYVIDGLPPTPICNPGAHAIYSVLHPAQTDALYFVAKGGGGHNFAKTLAEHNRNIASYRQWLAKHSSQPD